MQSSHLEDSVFLRMIKNKEEVTLINSYVKEMFMRNFSPYIWHNGDTMVCTQKPSSAWDPAGIQLADVTNIQLQAGVHCGS